MSTGGWHDLKITSTDWHASICLPCHGLTAWSQAECGVGRAARRGQPTAPTGPVDHTTNSHIRTTRGGLRAALVDQGGSLGALRGQVFAGGRSRHTTWPQSRPSRGTEINQCHPPTGAPNAVIKTLPFVMAASQMCKLCHPPLIGQGSEPLKTHDLDSEQSKSWHGD